MKNIKKYGLLLLLTSAGAFAQATDPNSVVTGAATTATSSWTSFAALSATAFVFAMVIGYSRKGKK